MGLNDQSSGPDPGEKLLLDSDSRWQLVQRIVASEGFQRASQLRSILNYISRLAILRQDEVPGEFEIAFNVLGRRKDFNPANDNIVRSQFSHLRRKLEHYFETEGKAETILLTIPKGSYTPVFAPHLAPADPQSASAHEPLDSVLEFTPSDSNINRAQPKWWHGRLGILAASSLGAVSLVLLYLVVRSSDSSRRSLPAAAAGNPFVQFLARSEGDVKVVEPDTSLVMIEDLTGSSISLSDYLAKDFPKRQIAMTKDPAIQQTISSLSTYRTVSANEGMIAVDFLETLTRVGSHAMIRYARDLHIEDLNDGNAVLIGGPNSDPWVTLFNDQTNFRHVDDIATHKGYFVNIHPAPGEPSEYLNVYSDQSEGYVDIALTQNLSQSGYVLLINGADMQANEAAARFLLHGRLPAQLTALLNRRDLRYFELFLRSKHISGEADTKFELVTFRIK